MIFVGGRFLQCKAGSCRKCVVFGYHMFFLCFLTNYCIYFLNITFGIPIWKRMDIVMDLERRIIPCKPKAPSPPKGNIETWVKCLE